MPIGDILSKSVHLYALALYKGKVYLLKKLQRGNRPSFSKTGFASGISFALFIYRIFIPADFTHSFPIRKELCSSKPILLPPAGQTEALRF